MILMWPILFTMKVRFWLTVICLFVFTFCDLTVSTDSEGKKGGILTILPDGARARFEAHQTLLLTCRGMNVEPGYFSDFQWLNRNNERIVPSHKTQLKQIPGSLSLIINDPEIGDSGDYLCTALYQNTKLLNASIEIVVFKSITWDDCPEDQYLIEGQEKQKIVCKVSSQPTSKIVWEKQGQELDKQKYSITNDGIMIKGPVSRETGGHYKIQASIQEHGILRDRSITVKVFVKPSIVAFDKYREVVEGQRTEVNCEASGDPYVLYSFLDNRRRNLSLTEGYSVDVVSGKLVIDSVKKDTENQFIECWAHNVAGAASQRMSLNVLMKPVIFQFENISYAEGSPQEWSCKVRGDPIPHIEIVKVVGGQDGLVRIPLPNDDSLYSFETKNIGPNEVDFRMKIKRVNRKDDGLYLCRANNKAGESEVVGHITVEFAPNISLTNTNVKTWANNPVNLTCIAEAIPNATFSWRFNNEEIYENSQYYSIYKGSGVSYLQVNPKSDKYVYGTYFCLAENIRGKNSVAIKLGQAYPPKAPTVRIIKARPTSIELELSAESDLPLKNYIVTYWRESEYEGTEAKQTWPASGKIYRLQHLTPSTRYRLFFSAESDVGIGDKTFNLDETTPRESKPEKPRFLFDSDKETHQLNVDGYVNSVFGDKFTVRWEQAEDNGRVIEVYILKYYKVHKTHDGYMINGEEYPSIQVRPKESLEYTLHGLNPNTFYKIELFAENTLGRGDPNELVFKTSATASDPSGWGQDLDYDESYASMGTALISVAISLIVILILMDIIFYIRCKVGVLYFIKSLIWPETSDNGHKKTKSNDFHPGNLTSISEVKRSSRSEIDNPAFDSNNGKIRSDELTPMMLVTDSRGDILDRVTNHQPPFRRPKDSSV